VVGVALAAQMNHLARVVARFEMLEFVVVHAVAFCSDARGPRVTESTRRARVTVRALLAARAAIPDVKIEANSLVRVGLDAHALREAVVERD